MPAELRQCGGEEMTGLKVFQGINVGGVMFVRDVKELVNLAQPAVGC
ncbi:hypothetical protein [Dactylosporangium sp. CA-092794]